MTIVGKRTLLLGAVASGLFYCAGLVAQSAVPASRIVDAVDESRLVTLAGTTHPLANAANDRGPAADNLQLDRMHLVLKRSAGQEASLRQLIGEMHRAGSVNYHNWLSADEFGRRFGPSDQDVATVKSWLEGHGFSVSKVNAGRQTIEFSGNVAQMRAAFHTQIHKYEVNGESHYANAGDPRIPAALAPVVGGFVSLNNFRLKSYAHLLGKASYDPKTDKATPQWTIGGNGGGLNYPLAPQDYAIQYDLNPLYKAGIDGSGQTIAIVNESNIDIALVNSFRSLFGLPYNPPRIIIDGNDPGVDGVNNPGGMNYASIEAYLDVEWSGAVAPKATIDLVIGGDTALENGLILALEHAVYSNVAPIISLSFGECEMYLGSSNQFLSDLYEQAAAQGITVLVSTGDSGSANCDSSGSAYAIMGQAVSGFASTPYNIGVGGTDFYYSDYSASWQTVDQQLATYWNSTPSNSTPAVSILGVIPEQPWNDSQYGLDIVNLYTATNGQLTTVGGGGGGASNSALCSSAYDSSNSCTGALSGYPKPAWQTGIGVPSDGVRDIPDVSLYAANGQNLSFYPICFFDGDCQPVSGSESVQFTGVGGTSASTPAFAGIMALVNQQYGRQGQAGYVLYPLAAQFPESFHDVTVGTNSAPCDITTSGCIPVSNPAIIDRYLGDPSGGTITEGQIGYGTTAEYNAGVGYDLATGLGTIDAANLVKNWNKVTFAATKTTLTPSQVSFAHGTAIQISGAVIASSGTPSSGAPTGDVALMTDSTDTVQQGQTLFTLSNGSYSGSVNFLPGGSYNIWGQYGGDAANGLSTSAPVLINVTPEASTTSLIAENLETYSGPEYVTSGTMNIPYGEDLVFYAQPAPSSNPGTYTVPTGTVAFADNGSPIATVALNAEGFAELNAAWSLGSHSITTSYSGDQSYSASSAAPFTFGIEKQTPWIGYSEETPAGSPASGSGMGTAHLTIDMSDSLFNTNANTAQPTGSVTLSSTPTGITGSATLTPSTRQSLAGFFIQAPPGDYALTVSYSGDANYNATTQIVTIPTYPIVIDAPGNHLASTTTATITGSISPTTSVTVNGSVTGQSGQPAPTGEIFIIDAGISLHGYLVTPGSGDVSTFSFVLGSQSLAAGDNFLTFLYGGDNVYNPSLFAPANPIVNPLSDFTLVPDSSTVSVAPGSSTSVAINLASVNGFNGAVALTCTLPAGLTCAIPSPASLSSGGVASASATVSAAAATPEGSYDVLIVGTDSTGKFVHTLGLKAIVGSFISSVPGFAVTNSGNIAVKAGATNGNLSTIAVASMNGFSGAVSLSCKVTTAISAPNDLPTCSLASSSVTVSSSDSAGVVLAVNTTASSSSSNRAPMRLWPAAGGTALALLFLGGIPRRRQGWAKMLSLLVLIVSLASVGCGVSSSGKGNSLGTTPGIYTVTVTGASGSLSQNTVVSVSVK
jgi:hypothetical protein